MLEVIAGIPFKNGVDALCAKNSNFYLYRVYNFDDALRTGDIMIIRGDITQLCMPVSYRVDLLAEK